MFDMHLEMAILIFFFYGKDVLCPKSITHLEWKKSSIFCCVICMLPCWSTKYMYNFHMGVSVGVIYLGFAYSS